MGRCPVYPVPLKNKSSLLRLFFRARRSWLDVLFERSYAMKMGHVHLPAADIFMVNQPDLVRRILIEQSEHFPKHGLLGRILKPLLGESIFTTNGAQWRRQRSMLDPAFEQARLRVVFARMNSATDALEMRLDRLAGGKVTAMAVEMTHVTAAIIFRPILSRSLDSAEALRIFEAFVRFQAIAPSLTLGILYRLPDWLVSGSGRRRSREAAQEIRGMLAQFIRTRYDAHQAGQAAAEDDILGSLLSAVDATEGTPFGFEELVDQVAMLFLAGHETSASALSWSLYLIASHPEIQQAMHEQAVAVLGEREPEFSDIKKMDLIGNVFRETLRLYPPVGFIGRETARREVMRDKVMRPGSSVVIAPWLIHRHRELWERPDEFDPYRYDTDSAKASLKSAYLPFGLGPRVCIGAAFAMQEAVLILARLVRRYRFEYLPEHEPKPIGRLTIRSESGVKLKLIRRET